MKGIRARRATPTTIPTMASGLPRSLTTDSLIFNSAATPRAMRATAASARKPLSQTRHGHHRRGMETSASPAARKAKADNSRSLPPLAQSGPSRRNPDSSRTQPSRSPDAPVPRSPLSLGSSTPILATSPLALMACHLPAYKGEPPHLPYGDPQFSELNGK